MTSALAQPAPRATRPPAGKPAPAPWVARPRPLRVGFVRLVDAAPLIAAVELGCARRRGLPVELSREIGWAAIRHRAVFDGLDVVHALGPLPLALTLGVGGPVCPCVAPLVLNLHGNAITLSSGLRVEGVADGPGLATHIFSNRRRHPLTLAVVARPSSHLYLLTHWLRQHGVDARRDLQLVVLPPDQLVRNLAAKNIDGFCAGAPWNSLAVAHGCGWIAATSAELDFGHPEKVLMATEDFATRREEEWLELAAAVLDACAWCDSAEGRTRLPAMLAQRKYLDVPAAVLARILQGPLERGDGRNETAENAIVFHRFRANEPTAEKALWMIRCLAGTEELAFGEKHLRETALRVYRADAYRAAAKRAEAAAG